MTDVPVRLPRRLALAVPLAGLAAGTLRIGQAKAALSSAQAQEAMCVLTPQSTEGPFFFDPKLVRRTIADGCPGAPLRLVLRVVDAASCQPMPGARVDVWHADAQGRYSGYPRQGDGRDIDTSGEQFLRGTQFADASGALMFETIWPGWYPGRATHIHFKLFLGERDVATGQIYFPDAVSEQIYADAAAYGGRRARRNVDNSNDRIVQADDPDHLGFCTVTAEPDGFRASLTIGVAPA
ncbi:MAG TPA: intradiol ring-cleavage dioxygenase [Geminicoccus sp.]|jgi:protocatechuate 3,4-dioxygenase beta subunit|uniref:intradiol ring-cleavage dioxygenase n=1 Tax=Geminicoccus sp. TaxID=2024832 RepID=UPI002E31C401|nr:intradiol ring-cleavage dioxygenase [Geminicoccus sp.]HEX2528027.1 intradiol ring-cleavage dioxygenase [Geminicoccus sp.]